MSGVQVPLTQRSRRRPRVELYKNVFQIQSLFGGRNLFQYLFAGANFVLVDTGIATTPEETILPYLDRLKISPERLTLVVVTHPDLDHQGGNDAMKRAAPRACLACGLAAPAPFRDRPRRLFSSPAAQPPGRAAPPPLFDCPDRPRNSKSGGGAALPGGCAAGDEN